MSTLNTRLVVTKQCVPITDYKLNRLEVECRRRSSLAEYIVRYFKQYT